MEIFNKIYLICVLTNANETLRLKLAGLESRRHGDHNDNSPCAGDDYSS